MSKPIYGHLFLPSPEHTGSMSEPNNSALGIICNLGYSVSPQIGINQNAHANRN